MNLILKKREDYIFEGDDIELFIEYNYDCEKYNLKRYSDFLNYCRKNIGCHFDDISKYEILSKNEIKISIYYIERII